MDYRHWIKTATVNAHNCLMDHARKLPGDKLNWQPEGTDGNKGRSAMDQLGECARVPKFVEGILEHGNLEWMTEESREAAKAKTDSITDLDTMDKAIMHSLGEMGEKCGQVPADELNQELQLMPEWSESKQGVMCLPLYNTLYHAGQIAYMQTMLGDHDIYAMPSATGGDFVGTDPRPLMKKMSGSMVERVILNWQAMPADKRQWTPTEGTRNADNLFGEMAQSPLWVKRTLEEGSMDWFTEDVMGGEMAGREAISQADSYPDTLRASFSALWEEADKIPADKLDDLIAMPFAEGWSESLQSQMYYPIWNGAWHYGQVAYIQTLYGDMENR